jgi:hypothetical protein
LHERRGRIDQQLDLPTDAKPIYSGEVDGLTKAANEVTAARALGNTETLADEAPPPADETPIEEVKLKARDERKTDDMGFDKGVTVKDAAVALADHREAKAKERAAFEAQIMGHAEPAQPVGDDATSAAARLIEQGRDEGDLGKVEQGLALLEAEQSRRDDLQNRAIQLEQRAQRAELQAQRAAAAANLPVETGLHSVHQALATEFPDAARFNDWTEYAYALKQSDPKRFERFVQWDNYAKQLVAQNYQQQQAVQHQAQRQQFDQAAAVEDQKFESAHPELKNPKVSETLRQGALEYLQKERGLSMEQIDHLYNVTGVLRSAEAQELLLDATRTYLARKGIANRPRAAVRPVQRPGAASGRYSHGEAEVRHLDARLSETGNLKDAAKLVAQRRRAR